MVIWISGGLVVWVFVALLLAVVLGRGFRLADSRPRPPATTSR